ncbi:helix-turn-helix domain-containing protein [Klebsiella aerogenes]|uniref:helix-turn-helix domain-containing protein n=1 Tax=Klebsiella aerogenes TaxID=548 RepID=UPI001F2A6B56|nr:helix-turn-helix domain-containing protein [Klebsiella aerogenes]
MSNKLSGYVWDGCASSGMKISSVAIMARLADFSSDEGVSWPSIATIARQVGAGESTVRTAIAQLEKDGWLSRKQRRNGNRNASNIYQLNVEKLYAAAHPHQSDSDTSKSEASESDASKFDPSESGKKEGFDPSESGGDPSVNSNTDPSVKKISCPGNASPDEKLSTDEFSKRHPEAVVSNPKKGLWGTQDDLRCAEWFFQKITGIYEKAIAADSTSTVTRPKEPDWAVWANDIRLMRTIDGRTHKSICAMLKRVHQDRNSCKYVQTPYALRKRWDELALKLCPIDLSDRGSAFGMSGGLDTSIPKGFRG